ncbi:MAG: hypothetical protein KDA68_04665 [Planctomycetaceae bacterium]|nr:hypothetical protein [Planctomycetaceae bacterium]
MKTYRLQNYRPGCAIVLLLVAIVPVYLAFRMWGEPETGLQIAALIVVSIPLIAAGIFVFGFFRTKRSLTVDDAGITLIEGDTPPQFLTWGEIQNLRQVSGEQGTAVALIATTRSGNEVAIPVNCWNTNTPHDKIANRIVDAWMNQTGQGSFKSRTEEAARQIAEQMLICPVCGAETDRLKRIEVTHIVFFLAGATLQEEKWTGCVDCLKKGLSQYLKKSLWTANIVWPFVLIFYWTGRSKLSKPGHSPEIIKEQAEYRVKQG